MERVKVKKGKDDYFLEERYVEGVEIRECRPGLRITISGGQYIVLKNICPICGNDFTPALEPTACVLSNAICDRCIEEELPDMRKEIEEKKRKYWKELQIDIPGQDDESG